MSAGDVTLLLIMTLSALSVLRRSSRPGQRGHALDTVSAWMSQAASTAIPAGADAPHLCTCSFPGLLALDTSTLVSGALSGPQRAHAGSPVCVQASGLSTCNISTPGGQVGGRGDSLEEGGIEVFELDAGIRSRKAPVDGDLGGIPLGLPGGLCWPFGSSARESYGHSPGHHPWTHEFHSVITMPPWVGPGPSERADEPNGQHRES